MPTIPLAHLDVLQKSKNLLAFSGGIDSSALFFLLVEHGVAFDIAIVDYGTRPQSQTEITHAKTLAQQHNLMCHVAKAPKFTADFEKQARDFRYDFFTSLIDRHGYANLVTAHQLNDRLEWLLMRLTKGAGTCELAGFEGIDRRKGYRIVRPLLEVTKSELLAYLKTHGYPYFIDKSNEDERFERNRFRKTFADPLIDRYAEGIKRTFAYLQADARIVRQQFETIFSHKEFFMIRLYSKEVKAKAADTVLKRLGYLLSAKQRSDIALTSSTVVGGKWAVESYDDMLYIAPYVHATMPKAFKEACRIRRIPPKVRPYLWREGIEPEAVRPIHKPQV